MLIITISDFVHYYCFNGGFMQESVIKYREFIVNRLGYFRNRSNISARELSLRLGYSAPYIAKFENGDFRMPVDVLLEAIEICGTTPEEFFAADVEKYSQNKEIVENFNKLSDESKQMIINLMKTMK